MKRILIYIVPILLVISSCSIDWNDDKDKKILALEKQVQDETFRKNKECTEFYEKNKEALYGSSQQIATTSIWYSSKLSSCFYAYSRRIWDLHTTQFLIDDLLKKESIFTSSLIVDNIEEEQSEWKRFHEKIAELKWECPANDPLCLFQ